jgi:hypothetical protein
VKLLERRVAIVAIGQANSGSGEIAPSLVIIVKISDSGCDEIGKSERKR